MTLIIIIFPLKQERNQLDIVNCISKYCLRLKLKVKHSTQVTTKQFKKGFNYKKVFKC